MKVNVDLWLRSHETFVASVKVTLLFDGNRMMTISDISVVANKSGGYFVSFPSREYKDAEGKRKYARFIGGDEDTMLTITNAILEKYNSAKKSANTMKKNNGEEELRASEQVEDDTIAKQVADDAMDDIKKEESANQEQDVPWDLDL